MSNNSSHFWRLRGTLSAHAMLTALTAASAGGVAGLAPTEASAQQALPGIEVKAQKRQKKKQTPRREPVRTTQPEEQPAPAAPQTPEGVVLNGGPAVTQTTAGPVSGYRALTGSTATRTDTPIERIPQTINVIPGAVIQDQHPLTHNEALYNVSGVVPMLTYNFLGDGMRVRGFAAERYLDGLPNFSDAGDFGSLTNVERIEVIKGPGGLFYQGGHGVIGGTINTVSKLPTDAPQYQAGTTFGSFGLWNQWFDVNQPLNANGTVLFRMTGEHSGSGDYVDIIERESYSLNPTLTITNKDTTTLTVQGRFSRREQQEYSGLPATGSLDKSTFSIRPDLFPGNPDVPKTTSEISSVTVKLDHKFDSIWSASVSARYGEMRVNEPGQGILSNTPDFPPSYFFYANSNMPETFTDFAISPSLMAKFAVGQTQNTLLLGADYNRVTERGQLWFDLFGASLVDLSDPHPSFPVYTDPTGTTVFGDPDNVYINSGATAQLQTTVWDRLHLLGGLRLAHVDIHNKDASFGTEFQSEETRLLPRVGAAFDIARGVTPYVSYSEGLRGVRFFSSTEAPKPEESEQIEGGVKFVLPHGLTTTLAVFEVTRANVATANPANPFVQIQTGEQRSRGFEADVTWQPTPALSIIASYAHVDARISEDNTIPVGNRLDRIPEDSGRLWANYKVLDGPLTGLSLGAGFYAASDQAVWVNNAYFTPGYVTVDAKIGYDIGRWSFALNAKNLLDQEYFVPYQYLDGRVAPGTPQAFYGSITYRY